jgi:hypothetical protein
MRENRLSGSMRGGARRSLGLSLSIRRLRLLYSMYIELCGLDQQNRPLFKSTFNLAKEGWLTECCRPRVQSSASRLPIFSMRARFCHSPEIGFPFTLMRFPG